MVLPDSASLEAEGRVKGRQLAHYRAHRNLRTTFRKLNTFVASFLDMRTQIKQAVVALSGGLDSAMAAILLLEQGWQVLGLHLLLTEAQPAAQVEDLGRFLGITIRRLDLRQEFRRQVIDYFRDVYLAGRTPNPCVRCNEKIKFGVLWEQVQSWGYSHLATGHYARIGPVAEGGWALSRGVDRRKEQSYFLHRLPREILSQVLFPLGGWTKDQVRAQAAALGLLPYVMARESQELCFIQGKYVDFLQAVAQTDAHRPGPIVDRNGVVLGSHRGLAGYTVGQRQGLGIAAAAPYYVLELVPQANQLVVGHKEDLLADVLQVEDINWLITPPTTTVPATVQLRYRHPGVGCRIHPTSPRNAYVTLDERQTAITPGQAAVFYQGDRVLGGGWIVRSGGR